jgi:Chain length determinant protein
MRAMGFRGLAPWLALVTLTAAGAAAAAGYALTAPKRYRAAAQLRVAPVSPSDPTFAGLDVLRDTGGKRTAAATVVVLLRTPQVLDAVRSQLAQKRSRSALLHALDTHVVDRSDVVAVTAEDTTPRGAAQLANTFASALVTQRTATFQSQLAVAIRRDEQLVAKGAGSAVKTRLAALGAMQARPDPTVQVASQAVPPDSAFWPDTPRLVGVGAASGAAAGLLAALALVLMRRRDARGKAEYDRSVAGGGMEKLAERLEQRIAARESALAARERDVQAKLDELRAAKAATEDDLELRRRERLLADREAELGRRADAVTKRDLELAERADELAARERELAAKEEELASRAAPGTAAAGDGAYNLLALERLVEERGREFPDRVEEWTSYLFFLRDYAASDGTVPASFDRLIQDTFADLVA